MNFLIETVNHTTDSLIDLPATPLFTTSPKVDALLQFIVWVVIFAVLFLTAVFSACTLHLRESRRLDILAKKSRRQKRVTIKKNINTNEFKIHGVAKNAPPHKGQVLNCICLAPKYAYYLAKKGIKPWCFHCKKYVPIKAKKGYPQTRLIKGVKNNRKRSDFDVIIQLFLSMDILRAHFLRVANNTRSLTSYLRDLFSETEPKAIKMTMIYSTSVFHALSHTSPSLHNAEELLNQFLKALAKEDPVFINSVFEGKYIEIVRCACCENHSEMRAKMKILNLPVQSSFDEETSYEILEAVSLESSLEDYIGSQQFFEEETWLCKDHIGNDYVGSQLESNSKRRVWIEEGPQILVVQLRRFTGNATGKVHGHVSFNDKLDLKDLRRSARRHQNSLTYALLGVGEHVGTLKNGSFISYVRAGPTWHKISEESVIEVGVEDVLKAEVYILVFEKILD